MDTYIRIIQVKLFELLRVSSHLFMPLSVICSIVVLVCLFVFINQDMSNERSDKSNTEIDIERDRVETDELSQKTLNEIYVDISGGVISPGIIKAPESSRVSDVVLLAGGFSNQVDVLRVSKSINLAKKVSDGEKIVIPMLGQENEEKEDLVSINDATASQLQTLKGIGQVRAEDIISNRPYSSIEELVDRNILPLTVFEGIKAKLIL